MSYQTPKFSKIDQSIVHASLLSVIPSVRLHPSNSKTSLPFTHFSKLITILFILLSVSIPRFSRHTPSMHYIHIMRHLLLLLLLLHLNLILRLCPTYHSTILMTHRSRGFHKPRPVAARMLARAARHPVLPLRPGGRHRRGAWAVSWRQHRGGGVGRV